MRKLKKIGKELLLQIKKDPIRTLTIASIVSPFLISLHNILSGSIPFWYDPARDYLLALNNLKHITLIGQPTGIPGVFYGPYWIWMISFGQILSKDPRFGAILILLIPYFTIFPFVFFKFSKILGYKITLLVWLLFIFSSLGYISLWNPNLAPLIFLIVVWLIFDLDISKLDLKNLLKTFFVGFTVGFLMNFHLSFGLAIFISSFIFLTILNMKTFFRQKPISKSIISFVTTTSLYVFGFIVVMTPIIVFEVRHNFFQTKAIIYTLKQSFLYNSAVVGQIGLTKNEIISYLLTGKLASMISFSRSFILSFYLIIIFYGFFLFRRKKISINSQEKKLLLFLVITLVSILLLFITSKNPVYEYHFIGVEIIFILLIGLLVKKILFFENPILLFVLLLVISSTITFMSSIWAKKYISPDLETKKYIVNLIYEDAGRKHFEYYAYETSIYTYDYDYIFYWLGKDIYHFQPAKSDKNHLVYLIIPRISQPIFLDFINYRTPNDLYVTTQKWQVPEGTTILKRELER